MEMKINFNKLFEISDSNSHTPSTTSLQNSYNFDEPSILSTQSNKVDLHYKFNEALFFDSQATMQNDNNLNILGDLSSIGRSFDDSFEKQAIQKLSQKNQKFQNQTPKLSKVKNDQQVFTKQTFGLSYEKNQKAPGQRLYYEHKINEERRLREVERLRIEKEEQQKKQITFKPAINQKSKKILQLADSPLRKMKNFKKSQKQIETREEPKSTAQKKHEQDLKNCTFHPVLIKTPKNMFTLNSLNERRNADKVFEQLYNDHKIKEMRRKQAQEQFSKKQKKMTPEQLEQFLQRNEEYLQQKLHKEELMRAVSSQYDLSSGRKLFEPKINENSQTLFNSASVKKFIESPSSKKSEFILQDEQDWPSEKILLNNQKSKSKKSRSRKSKNSKSSSKKQSEIKSKQLKLSSKNNEEQNQFKKEVQTPKNTKGFFKPLPYQVSKVPKATDQKQQIGHKYTESNGSERSQNSHPLTYEKPSSTIFSKMKATESVFEEKYEDEQQPNKSEKESVNSIKFNRKSSRSKSQKEKSSEKDQEFSQIQENEKMGWQKNVQNLWNPYEQIDEQRLNTKNEENNEQEEIQGSEYENEQKVSDNYKLDVDEQFEYEKSERNNFSREIDDKEEKGHFNSQADEKNSEPQDQALQFQEGNSNHQQDGGKDEEQQNVNDEMVEEKKPSPYQHEQQISNEELEQEKSEQERPEQEEKTEQEMKRSFLKLIESNPQINQKYQNLFDLEHEVSRPNHESPATQRESINVSSSSDEPQQDPTQFQHIQNFNNLEQYSEDQGSRNQEAIHQIELKEVSPITKHTHEITYSQLQLPLQRQSDISKSQQPATKKSWQQIFNSSTNVQSEQTSTHLPYSHRQKKNEDTQESHQFQTVEESPKKKPINIASLLKGKKKATSKPEQN